MENASEFSVLVTIGGSLLLLVLIVISAITASREYRSREADSWLRNLMMGFSTRIQGEQRLSVLGDSVLSFLAQSVGAHVGAVYIANGGGSFRRFAGYALAPSAAESVIRPGDGRQCHQVLPAWRHHHYRHEAQR